MMDNENELVMKKTKKTIKTTTMMTNTNENDQRKEREKGEEKETERNNQRLPKQSLCVFSGSTSNRRRRNQALVGKPERRVSFGHPPMHRVYFVDFFVSRPFVSYDVCDLSILLLFGPNSTIRVIVRERRVGDMLDFAVCENHRRRKRTFTETRRTGGIRRESRVVYGYFQFVSLETTV
jgi:hypothetical protein